MAEQVELMAEWENKKPDYRPSANWTPPQRAFSEDLPGVSAYLHYWQELRKSRDETAQDPQYPPHMKDALGRLVREGFGQ